MRKQCFHYWNEYWKKDKTSTHTHTQISFDTKWNKKQLEAIYPTGFNKKKRRTFDVKKDFGRSNPAKDFSERKERQERRKWQKNDEKEQLYGWWLGNLCLFNANVVISTLRGIRTGYSCFTCKVGTRGLAGPVRIWLDTSSCWRLQEEATRMVS